MKSIYRARLRPWPGGPAALVGCKLPCLWSMARKRAWLPRAKIDLSAWLSGNDRNPRFFGAELVYDARGRFWAAAGWLARALAGRGNVFARVPALRSRSGRRTRSEMAAISPAFIYGFPLSTLYFFHSVLALPPPS